MTALLLNFNDLHVSPLSQWAEWRRKEVPVPAVIVSRKHISFSFGLNVPWLRAEQYCV